ncbi:MULTISPECIES: hypothetical protein [Nocardiaceae]|uniref:DUF3995 domain-containing protein n=1 Tax=Rhodococcoides yunnanense TaxID=278209 RepID=A0ABU4BED8_9NOCA|nr:MULTISPECIES: hypothetical protein [Rhodococcus]MDI9896309.1 hypothetical protein [Rhodococcus sp. IEGM 1381]MDV6262577.1 hypothetical protein [Rhodococcus yunnanensis]
MAPILRPPAAHRTVAYFLALSSAVFAAVHVAWAAGWRGGVPAEIAPIGERPVFLAYDLVATAIIAIGAGLFAWFGTGIESTVWHRRVTFAMLVGSCLALARGVPASMLDVVTLAQGGQVQTVGIIADLWFGVVGTGGFVIARSARRLRSTRN